MRFPQGANGGSKSVLVMGIVNLSPDSFFAGNASAAAALKTAERLMEEGADILDIGAESSRPGSRPVPAEVELERLVPVVSEICKRFKVPVSVDTCKPAVAERALSLGAEIINDITGLQKFPRMAEIIAAHGAGVVLMHMRGSPETMQENPRYDDVIGEIAAFLGKSVALAEAAGIAPDRIAVDPGIGFGKTVGHNLEILRNLDGLKKLRKPILLGASRKSFIGHVLDLPAEERLEGSLAAAVIGVQKGASILRVHDVKETARAVRLAQAVFTGKERP
jgi:dihydropteroate synthase